MARDERERAARQAHLQEAEADFDLLPFDRGVSLRFRRGCFLAASIREENYGARLRRADRGDALADQLPVYTDNFRTLRRDRRSASRACQAARARIGLMIWPGAQVTLQTPPLGVAPLNQATARCVHGWARVFAGRLRFLPATAGHDHCAPGGISRAG